ncbi:hypothetical protein PM8797T_21188 [Gimesia maris DSM 8797]|nr:hypothetical protein PM8797T_21188 [Gimesia maris DSM 8797]
MADPGFLLPADSLQQSAEHCLQTIIILISLLSL